MMRDDTDADNGMPESAQPPHVSATSREDDDVVTPDEALPQAAAVDEVSAVLTAEPQQTWFQRLLKNTFGRDQFDRSKRLAQLTYAIYRYPEAVSNYVLRGELYLQRRMYEAAVVDFRMAIRLSEAAISAGDWAVVEQALQDRAWKGLERSEPYITPTEIA